MNGAHPFQCSLAQSASKSVANLQQVTAIRKCESAFFHINTNADIPPYAPQLDKLPPDIQQLTRRTFIDGHSSPTARPNAQEWVDVLRRLYDQVASCTKNKAHEYYKGLRNCPWCEVDTRWAQANARAQQISNSGTISVSPPPIQSTRPSTPVAPWTPPPPSQRVQPPHQSRSRPSREFSFRNIGCFGVILLLLGGVFLYAFFFGLSSTEPGTVALSQGDSTALLGLAIPLVAFTIFYFRAWRR